MEYQDLEFLEEKSDYDIEETYDCLTSNKKCGEIFMPRNEKFYIVCVFCIIRFTEFEEFTTHYAKKHYDNSTNPLDVIRNEENDEEGGDEKSEVDIVIYNDNDSETSDTYVQENYCIDNTRIETTTTLIETDLVEESIISDKKNTYSTNDNNITKSNANIKVNTIAKNKLQSIFVNKFDSCGKTFPSEIKLQEHKIYDHSPVDPFFDLENDIDCKREDDDQVNIQSVQEQSQLPDTDVEIDTKKCRYCPRILKCRTVRIQHERIHTGERPFKCETCGKSFSSLKYCKRHESFHTGIKPFKCDMCDASFSVNGSLKKHILRHKGVKTYSCSYCEKKFVDNAGKRIHERVHTGERPFQCMNCGKCFITSSALFQHRKSHHSSVVEKPFKCELCDKCFTRSYSLKTHSATHSDLRPFSCKICNKTFKLRERLRSHLNIHSDVPKYTCNICGKGSKQPAVFASHMKSHGVINMK